MIWGRLWILLFLLIQTTELWIHRQISKVQILPCTNISQSVISDKITHKAGRFNEGTDVVRHGGCRCNY